MAGGPKKGKKGKASGRPRPVEGDDLLERLAERVPPQNIEAERGVLACMLLEGEATGLAAEILVPDDFYNSAHKLLFEAIRQLYDDNHQPDEIVVTEYVRQRGILEKVGGREYIHGLVMSVPSAAFVEQYAHIVKQKAVARSLINAATSILRDAEDSINMAELLDRSEQKIFEVASNRASTDVVRIKDILDEAVRDLEVRMETPGVLTGIETGFPELDNMTGGFQRSDFLILAARPSVGKTALALNIVEHVAHRRREPVLFFSLEMSKQQVAMRLLSSSSGVSFTKLRSGSIDRAGGEWEHIDNVAKDISQLPIFIDDKAAISGMELRAKARRMKAQHDIRMVAVDYLQLMRANVRSDESREREVAQLSGALKALARELSVPVLALSQLRRGAEERRGGKPLLADLRYSGSLEQDADVVMILHRGRDQNGAQLNEATLNVAKQRNGPTGEIKLRFTPSRMRFTEQGYAAEA